MNFVEGDGAEAMRPEAARDPVITALVQRLQDKSTVTGISRGPAKAAQPQSFGAALRQELALKPDDDPKSLRGLARRLISEAAEAANPLSAIKEIANRLDSGDAKDGTPETIDRIERIIVYPENRDR